MDKWIYLPLDVKVRELHAKLLFAAAGAKKGYKVMIGRKKEVHETMKFFPPGYYLGLGAQKNFFERYKKLKKSGHIVSAMDEEGLVTLDDEIYKRLRVSPDSFQMLDIFYTWGKHQTDNLSKDFDAKKLAPVGNLRLDTLTPELRDIWTKDIGEIKNQYDRYVLVVSSFGSANHYDGREKYFQSLKDKKIIQNPQDEEIYRRYIDLKKINLDAYIEAVPKLALQYPNLKFILRPHPSESHDLWKQAAEAAPNIILASDRSIQPWIIGAEMVIHHFCTSAVEALLANVPSIAYRPFHDDNIESRISYECSLEAFSEDELLHSVGSLLSGDHQTPDRKRQASINYYKNYLSNQKAYTKMLECYDSHRPASLSLFAKIKLFLKYQKDFFAKADKNSAYLDHKFPELTKNEIEEILISIKNHLDIKDFKIKKIKNSCFVVTAK